LVTLLLDIFLTDILPVFAVAGVGLWLARRTPVSPKMLSSITFNALAPALVFNLLVTASVSVFDFGRMALFTVVMAALNGLAARLTAIPLRLDRPALASFLLVTMFSNSGNFGLPVTLFAFGREALTFGTAYFVTASILSYTVGVFLAASGQRSVKDALVGISRVPTVYGVGAALVVLAIGVRLPLGVMRPIQMLSDAALPMMILTLGMQLHGVAHPKRPLVVAAAVVLSLVVAPLMAFGLATVMGLTGPAFQAAVLQASMPAAVVTTVLALQFDLDPEFPTAVVLLSTILSPLTLTALIAYLR
jgi:predicted permease